MACEVPASPKRRLPAQLPGVTNVTVTIPCLEVGIRMENRHCLVNSSQMLHEGKNIPLIPMSFCKMVAWKMSIKTHEPLEVESGFKAW